jgi:hypothetical protein
LWDFFLPFPSCSSCSAYIVYSLLEPIRAVRWSARRDSCLEIPLSGVNKLCIGCDILITITNKCYGTSPVQCNVAVLAFDFGFHLRPCTTTDTSLSLDDPHIGSRSGARVKGSQGWMQVDMGMMEHFLSNCRNEAATIERSYWTRKIIIFVLYAYTCFMCKPLTPKSRPNKGETQNNSYVDLCWPSFSKPRSPPPPFCHSQMPSTAQAAALA